MYENIAWENFIKTGNVESFMEYKKIKEIKNNLNSNNDVKGTEESCD